MCSKLDKPEAEGSLSMTCRDCIAQLRRRYDYMAVVMFNFFIGLSLIYAVHHVNLRTDALQNVTRIRSQESSNETPYEDFSNCTILSLKYCEQLYTGLWYIETNNSLNGKLKKYSYYMDDGKIVLCKEVREGNLNENLNRHDLPCSYYVGLYVSFACLLSTAVIALFEGKEVKRILHFNLVGASFSYLYFIMTLIVIGLFILGEFRDFAGNPLETAALSSTFPAMIHFYLLAIVGWMSIFSHRHCLVMWKRTAVSTSELAWFKVFFRWIPFCVYISVFFFVNWLLSYAAPLFPRTFSPACDVSCWLTQESLVFSFAAPVVTFMLFNLNGKFLLWYSGSQLPDPLFRDYYCVITKMFYVMVFIWFIGITAVNFSVFAPLRTVFNVITLFEGIGVLVVGLYFESDRFRN